MAKSSRFDDAVGIIQALLDRSKAYEELKAKFNQDMESLDGLVQDIRMKLQPEAEPIIDQAVREMNSAVLGDIIVGRLIEMAKTEGMTDPILVLGEVNQKVFLKSASSNWQMRVALVEI